MSRGTERNRRRCFVAYVILFQTVSTIVLIFLVIRSVQMEDHRVEKVHLKLTSTESSPDKVKQLSLNSIQKEIAHTKESMRTSDSLSSIGNFVRGNVYHKEQETAHGRLKRAVAPQKVNRSSAASAAVPATRRRRGRRLKSIMDEVKRLEAELKGFKDVFSHPSAHMVLLLPENKVSGLHQVENPASGFPFRWKVERNSIFDDDDTDSYFIVKTSGVYFIYLQITYRGQTKVTNPTCSNFVMVENLKYRSRKKHLLYGSTTQYKLGDTLLSSPKGPDVKPIDSVYLSGVFYLLVNDRLSVKPDDFSKNCIVSTHPDKTFFGAFRLQSSVH